MDAKARARKLQGDIARGVSARWWRNSVEVEELIATALRSARDAGLEEAAVIATERARDLRNHGEHRIAAACIAVAIRDVKGR